jgi:hypothetical protein
VRLTAKHPNANLRVEVPPKPGLLDVRAINSAPKAEISDVTVSMKLPGRPKKQSSELGGETDGDFPVPPDRDVIVHVKSDGFREASETRGRGKVVHISSGARMTLEVHLDPLQH